MSEKKRILLLTTGGTIASVPGGEGLEPHRSDVMERELNQLRTYYDITVEDLICLDSSNIRPEEWQLIAAGIFRSRASSAGESCPGVIEQKKEVPERETRSAKRRFISVETLGVKAAQSASVI